MVEALAAATTHLHFVGECPDVAHCNYIHKAMGLLSDGPHITAEAVVDLVENAVIATIIWFFARRALSRQHAQLDAEHGVTHHVIPTPPKPSFWSGFGKWGKIRHAKKVSRGG